MHDAVRAAFVDFTAPLEGVVRHMYLDVRGLVTTGIGNLIDPVQYATPLPWLRSDGSPASVDEIVAEWRAVKSRLDLAPKGGMVFDHLTKLRLTDEGVNTLVQRKLAQNDVFLAHRFAEWSDWPADAQLAAHSMAWACGPAFRFPMLDAALRRKDFAEAAKECAIHPAMGTIIARNAENARLFLNAARSTDPPSVLHWPNWLGVDRAADTPKELPSFVDPDEAPESPSIHVFPIPPQDDGEP